MHLFSKGLSELVRSSPMKVSEIARKAGISRPSLYDLLKANSLPRKSTLERLIEVIQPSARQVEFLHFSHQIERLRSTRSHRMIHLRDKQHFVRILSELLLAKGHEIARSPKNHEIDLVLRIDSKKRIPIIADLRLLDPTQTLGDILFAMHELSTTQGVICVSSLKGLSRTIPTVFGKHGVKIITPKALFRDLK
mgnify:FL=1